MARKAGHYPFEREFLDQVARLGVLADQTACLIHGEFNLANAILTSHGRIYLVDWDQAGSGPWVLEAGYPLLTAFLTEDLTIERELAVAFYDAYTSEVGLTPERLELVFTAGLQHALCYLEFGDPLRRWARIRFALEHKDELLTDLAGNLHLSERESVIALGPYSKPKGGSAH